MNDMLTMYTRHLTQICTLTDTYTDKDQLLELLVSFELKNAASASTTYEEHTNAYSK
jgi:hypothetical protein